MTGKYFEEYKRFLDKGKTETETVRMVWEMALSQGFRPFPGEREREECPVSYQPGERLIQNIRGKGLVLAVIGNRPLKEGCKMIAAHVDSPRLDLKPEPLHEKEGLVYLKTHYYGGIKKYQWTCIPMALHGRLTDRNGQTRTVVIGENQGEPVLGISDLLYHLSGNQMEQRAEEAVPGEKLQLLSGIWGSEGTGDAGVRTYLKEQFDLDMEDLKTAEFEAVPAWKASDFGLDRSMISAYGQDDRVCAYGAVRALFDSGIPEFTSVVLLSDQEEVGSESSAGLRSRAFLELLSHVAESQNTSLYRVMAKAECLSADVVCGHDPMYPEATDFQNTAKMGKGMVMVRYTGRGGKKGNHSASAAFMGKISGILEENQILWQCGEMGAVDAGGGTTVAKCLAEWGAEVLDVGVPLLSMHSPMELSAKADIWNFYLGMKAFLKDSKPHLCENVLY